MPMNAANAQSFSPHQFQPMLLSRFPIHVDYPSWFQIFLGGPSKIQLCVLERIVIETQIKHLINSPGIIGVGTGAIKAVFLYRF